MVGVAVTSGPPDFIGEYTKADAGTCCSYSKLQASATGSEAVTAATLHFDSVAYRWKLTIDDEGRITEYSSKDNAERRVPWNGKYEMNGENWELDSNCIRGLEQGPPLTFKGTDASRCPSHELRSYVTR